MNTQTDKLLTEDHGNYYRESRQEQQIVRPADVPDTGGCPSDCGHSEAEHIAFDIGVRDGRNGTEVMPLECTIDSDPTGTLREAWLTGQSVGVMDRPNRVDQRPKIAP